MSKLVVLMLLFFSLSVNSAVRWNQFNRTWEGNICMNNIGWQIVNWQPLGSMCMINIPGYPMMQGIIVNL